jgi:hypothetical protein
MCNFIMYNCNDQFQGDVKDRTSKPLGQLAF